MNSVYFKPYFDPYFESNIFTNDNTTGGMQIEQDPSEYGFKPIDWVAARKLFEAKNTDIEIPRKPRYKRKEKKKTQETRPLLKTPVVLRIDADPKIAITVTPVEESEKNKDEGIIVDKIPDNFEQLFDDSDIKQTIPKEETAKQQEETVTQILQDDDLDAAAPDMKDFPFKEEYELNTLTLEDKEAMGQKVSTMTIEEVVNMEENDPDWRPTLENALELQETIKENKEIEDELKIKKREKVTAAPIMGVQSRFIINSVKKVSQDIDVNKQLKRQYAKAMNEVVQIPNEDIIRKRDLINTEEYPPATRLRLQIETAYKSDILIPKSIYYTEWANLQIPISLPLPIMMAMGYFSDLQRTYVYYISDPIINLFNTGLYKNIYIKRGSVKGIKFMGLKTLVYSICEKDEDDAYNVSDDINLLWIPLFNNIGEIFEVMLLYWPGKTEDFAKVTEGTEAWCKLITRYNQRMLAITKEINGSVAYKNFSAYQLYNFTEIFTDIENQINLTISTLLLIYFQGIGKHLIATSNRKQVQKYQYLLKKHYEVPWIQKNYSIGNQHAEAKNYIQSRTQMKYTVRFYDTEPCLYNNSHVATRWNDITIKQEQLDNVNDFRVTEYTRYRDISEANVSPAAMHAIRNFHNTYRQLNNRARKKGDRRFATEYRYKEAVNYAIKILTLSTIILTNDQTLIARQAKHISDAQMAQFNNIFFDLTVSFQSKKKKKKKKKKKSIHWLNEIRTSFD